MAQYPVGSVTHAGPRGGVVTGWSPWTCREEWEEVYSWLYSSEPTLVKRGVGRVCAWKSRGHVPMMVEMTADLCECRLHERNKQKGGAYFQVLALQYSMAITRYRNIIACLTIFCSIKTLKKTKKKASIEQAFLFFND